MASQHILHFCLRGFPPQAGAKGQPGFVVPVRILSGPMSNINIISEIFLQLSAEKDPPVRLDFS